MMFDRQLNRNEWQPFLAHLTARTRGRRVEVELCSQDVGDQIDLACTVVESVSYNADFDTLWLHTPRLSYWVAHPEEIFFCETTPRKAALGIRGRDGRLRVAKIEEWPLLEGPHS